ncbi:hypothetical protein DYB25_007233 [Aphanomyces astaci]|uniref:Metallo-beta-lactamase domain-containing protein n=1 Tax=Aphanomyces astaci TaxID=112090 RepID=A0A397BP04_APHAT|nr:hypothetical protein DYB25_007233 [Aphanomyces astaci]
MDITFLGTASAQPSPTRNHSSLAFRPDGGDVWLFDCGEATQHQLINLMADYTALAIPAPGNVAPAHSAPRLAKISRIFLTHLHGDHCFGLPGLLCTAGSVVALVTTSGYAYWTLPPTSSGFVIQAAAIPHTVPTVGYLLREPASPGRLQIELVRPILQRNSAALGLKNPLSLLPRLKRGESLVMPDGTVMSPELCLASPRPGRVVLILGDTSNALESAFVTLSQDDVVDVVVHEATNACLPCDMAAGLTTESVEINTKAHGHSTPDMAGAFARAIKCKRLILNHFPSRYKGDGSTDSMDVMDQVRQLAVASFGSDDVVCARDFMQVTGRDDGTAVSPTPRLPSFIGMADTAAAAALHPAIDDDDAWMEYVNFILCLVMLTVLLCHRVCTFHLAKPAPLSSIPTASLAKVPLPPTSSTMLHQFHEWCFATSATDASKERTILDDVIDSLLLTSDEPLHHEDALSPSGPVLIPKLCEAALIVLVFTLQAASHQHHTSFRSFFCSKQ